MTTLICCYKYITNTATLILWLQVHYKYNDFNFVYDYFNLWLKVHYKYNNFNFVATSIL